MYVAVRQMVDEQRGVFLRRIRVMRSERVRRAGCGSAEEARNAGAVGGRGRGRRQGVWEGRLRWDSLELP